MMGMRNNKRHNVLTHARVNFIQSETSSLLLWVVEILVTTAGGGRELTEKILLLILVENIFQRQIFYSVVGVFFLFLILRMERRIVQSLCRLAQNTCGVALWFGSPQLLSSDPGVGNNFYITLDTRSLTLFYFSIAKKIGFLRNL